MRDSILDTKVSTKITKILESCVKRTIVRVNKTIKDNNSPKPFHQALLTEDIVKISSFERSFSTSFGQGPIEEISQVLAIANGYKAERQKESMLTVYKGAVDEIERICSALRDGNNQPNWTKEKNVVTSFDKGDTVVKKVISDLWMKKDNKEYFLTIKTVKPNLDQSEKAKKDMLLLKAGSDKYSTFLGLYYNPYGLNRSDYKHNFPMKIFNMHKDECVLIGKDYWDFIGGVGTYEELIKVFALAGVNTKTSLLNF
jgi:hypothetical protein